MTATVDLYTTIRSMLMVIVPSVEVVRGLGNDVSMPTGPFISMTATGMRRLATNRHIYTDLDPLVGTVANEQSTALEIQVDCYGPASADWANSVVTMWRDQYATNLLRPIGAAPLYAEDPRMMALENSSKNYEERWIVLLTLQYNPQTVTPMYFFDNLPISIGQPL